MIRDLLLKGAAIFAKRPPAARLPARFVGRRKTADVAFNLRMNAGSAGDITRHAPPATIEACLNDPTTPATAFGQAVLADLSSTNAVRLVQSGDSSLTAIYGITVRPFPIQQGSATNYGAIGFGAGAPASGQPLDVLRSGYILGPCLGTPVKGGTVYVWVAASSGSHVQGAFETSSTGGSTITLDSKTTFQGGLDANGLAEIAFNI